MQAANSSAYCEAAPFNFLPWPPLPASIHYTETLNNSIECMTQYPLELIIRAKQKYKIQAKKRIENAVLHKCL